MIKYNIYIKNACLPHQAVNEVKAFINNNFTADDATNILSKIMRVNSVAGITKDNKHILIERVG